MSYGLSVPSHAPLFADMGLVEHYIIPAEGNDMLYDHQHGHPVLVVPVGYFQKQSGKARPTNPAIGQCQCSCPSGLQIVGGAVHT